MSAHYPVWYKSTGLYKVNLKDISNCNFIFIYYFQQSSSFISQPRRIIKKKNTNLKSVVMV